MVIIYLGKVRRHPRILGIITGMVGGTLKIVSTVRAIMTAATR